MGPKPRPRPQEWSLEKAKQQSAKDNGFDQRAPKLPEPKPRGEHGKFVPTKDKHK